MTSIRHYIDLVESAGRESVTEARFQDRHYVRAGNVEEHGATTSAEYHLKDGDALRVMTREKASDEDDGRMIEMVASIDGKAVGTGKFYYQQGEFQGEFHRITVLSQFRRRGIATVMYDHLERLGFRVESSSNLEADGLAMWGYRYRRAFEGVESAESIEHKPSHTEEIRIFDAYLKKYRISTSDLMSMDDAEAKRHWATAMANHHLYAIARTDPGYLYHGTGKARLPAIVLHGLIPSKRSRWARSGLTHNSLGRVFFADTVDKAEFYGRAASRKNHVILRVRKSDLPDMKPDTQEEDGCCFYVERSVSPEQIEVWGGKGWVRLKGSKHAGDVLPESAAYVIAETKEGIYLNMNDMRVPIYGNPSKAEIAGLRRRTRYGDLLRGFMVGEDVFMWDGGLATHYEIARHLGYGLSEILGFEMENGKVDFLYNPPLHRDIDPDEVVKKMEDHPALRSYPITRREWTN